MITIEEDKKCRPVEKTNILLSKESIDTLALASLSAHYIDKSSFVEYTTSSGQKIMLAQGFISVGKNAAIFDQLLGQTYPIHCLFGQPQLMTDYLFLATADGRKGAPWTRDPKTFEFFIRAAQKRGILHQEYVMNGKRYIDTPYARKFIFDSNAKDENQ